MFVKLFKSFFNSLNGIKSAFKIDKSVKLEFLMTIPVVFVIIIIFKNTELYILILLWFFIIITELLNTSIEKAIDLISPERSHEIKKIKDISSAAVFISVLLFLIFFLFFLIAN